MLPTSLIFVLLALANKSDSSVYPINGGGSGSFQDGGVTNSVTNSVTNDGYAVNSVNGVGSQQYSNQNQQQGYNGYNSNQNNLNNDYRGQNGGYNQGYNSGGYDSYGQRYNTISYSSGTGGNFAAGGPGGPQGSSGGYYSSGGYNGYNGPLSGYAAPGGPHGPSTGYSNHLNEPWSSGHDYDDYYAPQHQRFPPSGPGPHHQYDHRVPPTSISHPRDSLFLGKLLPFKLGIFTIGKLILKLLFFIKVVKFVGILIMFLILPAISSTIPTGFNKIPLFPGASFEQGFFRSFTNKKTKEEMMNDLRSFVKTSIAAFKDKNKCPEKDSELSCRLTNVINSVDNSYSLRRIGKLFTNDQPDPDNTNTTSVPQNSLPEKEKTT